MLPAEGRQGEDPSPPPLPGTAKAPRPPAAAPSPAAAFSPEPMATTASMGAASSSSSSPPAPSSASPSSASASPPSASHPDAVRILAADVSPLGHSPPPSPPGPGRAAAAEIFAESGAEAEIEIEFEAESESESEIEFEAESEFQIEFEAESEIEFEAESESESAAASASFRSPAFSPAKVQKGPAEPRGEDDSPITKATRIGRSGGAGGGGSGGAVPGPASSDLDPGRGLSVPEDAEQDGHDGAEAGGDPPGEAGGPPDLSAIAHAVLRTAEPGGGGPESEGEGEGEGGVEGEGEGEGGVEPTDADDDDADGGSSRGGISHLSGIGLRDLSGIGLRPLSRDHSVHSLVLSADYVATQEAGLSAQEGLGLAVSLLRGAPEAPGGDGGDADLELGGGGGADEDADTDGGNAGQPMGASFLGPDLNRRSTSPGPPMLPGGGTGDDKAPVDRESPQKLDSSFAGLERKVKDRLEPLCSHVPRRAVLVLVLTLLLVVLGLYGIYDAMVKDATQFRSPSDDLFDPDPVPVSDPVPAADQGS